MAVDEARRSRSCESLAAAIGRDEAVTIFELFPPQGADLATRADVQVLDERFGAMERRFDERFGAMERRFDGIERELRALRSDVTTAIAGQTRALLLGVLTATVSIGGLSAAFAQLL